MQHLAADGTWHPGLAASCHKEPCDTARKAAYQQAKKARRKQESRDDH